jgi:hypothetical protein
VLSPPVGYLYGVVPESVECLRVSRLLIQHYLNAVTLGFMVSCACFRKRNEALRNFSESVVREAFKTLLKDWGKSRDLIFIPEYEYQTLQKTRVYPDGALLHAVRVPLGYWEAKDEADDLDEEIEKKFRKGYPQDNIIFDDSHDAILIQNKHQVMRCGGGRARDADPAHPDGGDLLPGVRRLELPSPE